MKKIDVATMSGLTLGQIDQLISRHGIELHARPRFGAARDFTPADVFMINLAGQLRAVSVKNENISSAIASIMPKVAPDSFEPVEIYPGRAALEAAGEPVYALVAQNEKNEMVTEFVRLSHLDIELSKIGAAAGIVVCASLIADTIERLEGGRNA